MEIWAEGHDKQNGDDRGASTARFAVSEHVKSPCSSNMLGDVSIDVNALVPFTTWTAV
jgi:hypothetical protein